ARAELEAPAVIPAPWAQTIALAMLDHGVMFAHREAVRHFTATYRFAVDGFGDAWVAVRDGDVHIEREGPDPADVTIHCSADQFVRLLAGRCKLDSGEGQRLV